MNAPCIPPSVRVYTCYIDGVLHVKALPRVPGEPAHMVEPSLNRHFHAWLEETAPGAHAAGRVTGIAFADYPK